MERSKKSGKSKCFIFGVEVFSCPFSVVRSKPHAEAQRARRGIFSFQLSVFSCQPHEARWFLAGFYLFGLLLPGV